MWANGKNRYTNDHLHLMSLLHDPMAVAFSNAMQHKAVLRYQEMLADDNRFLQQELQQLKGGTIVGANSGLKQVVELVRQVARMDSPVLILGETGTGKEVIARTLHQQSSRREGPFIKANSRAIPAIARRRSR